MNLYYPTTEHAESKEQLLAEAKCLKAETELNKPSQGIDLTVVESLLMEVKENETMTRAKELLGIVQAINKLKEK
ncbi:hypothetical protein JQC92_09370 [Shewanella sp. 202IG2-18]|uniref:hypothetical protein n=1 Tax=Parashewanella hymeniacidonis TaxID=2807618 RepID=UPI00195F6725|nr:hypothetical protein [Parashewanella hymeniacidonis]MBM7072235.1 hypothetical protein [Parashewanella hymeniacidonis]